MLKNILLALISISFTINLTAQDHASEASVQVMLPEVQDMELLSTWQTGSREFNDVWGYVDSQGDEVGIIGSRSHYYFVDISDPTDPELIDGFAGGNVTIWRDMKTYGQWAYGVCDSCNEGLSIFKLGDSPKNNGVDFVRQDKNYFTSAHNIFIDEEHGRMYVIGSNSQRNGVIILDLKTNPEIPTLLASVNVSGGYMHDLYVRNHIGYGNSEGRGLFVYNFSTPTNPQTLGSMNSYPQQGYNHAGWLNPAGDVLIMADETHNTSLKAVDVSDLSDIEVTSLFRSELLAPAATGSIAHNPFVRDNYAVVSYYHDGVQIFDISNPANVQQVAWYDTFTGNTNYNGFSGCWGVYPYLPSGNILGSDGAGGLFVLRPTQISFSPIPPVQPPFAFLNEAVSPCVEQGTPVTLELTTDGDVIQWFRNGNLVGFSDSYTALSEGIYTAVVYKGPHSFTLDPIEIVYGSAPDVSLNVESEIDLCEGDEVELMVAAGADSYDWFLNGDSFAAQGNTLTTGGPGVYMVTATKDGCGATSEEVSISVLEYPSGELNVFGPQIACATEGFLLETSVNANAYQWLQDGEAIVGETSSQLNVMEAGFYSLEISDGDCVTTSEVIPIELPSAPIVALNATEAVSACEGEFFLLETTTQAILYDWMIDGMVVQSSDEASFLATVSGTYQLVVTTDHCTASSDPVSVTITTIPSVGISATNDPIICVGETNTLTSNFEADNYQWFFNGQAIDDANEESFTTDIAGAYSLEVSNNNCTAMSSDYNLTVVQFPVVNLDGADEVSFCEGETTMLSVSGQADSYRWLKDGEIFVVNAPSITVTEPGIYSVQASNVNCPAEEIVVTVNSEANPFIDIYNDDLVLSETTRTFCSGEEIILLLETNASDYIWTRNGQTIAQNESSLIIDAPGVYQVQSLGLCQTFSTEITVTQAEVPNAEFALVDFQNLCEGSSLDFIVQAGYADYQWTQNGNVLNETSNILTATETATYQVMITSADGCVAFSDAVALEFQASPFAQLDLNDEENICEGSSIFLEAPEAGAGYIWFRNTTPISTEQSVEVSEAGVYQLQLTSNGCSSFSQEVVVSVTATPMIEFTFDADIRLCEGESFATNLDLDFDTYQWYLDGAPFASDMNIEISESGDYFLEATSNNCVGTSMITTVVVETLPEVSLNVEGETAICDGDSIRLIASVNNIGDYHWYRDGVLFNDDNFNYVDVDIAGTYTVEAFGGLCSSFSEAAIISINPTPLSEISGEAELFLCEQQQIELSTTIIADQYTWFLNDNEIAQSVSPVLEVTEAGQYTLLTSLGDCATLSEPTQVTLIELPDVSDISDDLIFCDGVSTTINAPLGAETYTWYKDGDLFLEGANSLEISDSGMYSLSIQTGDCNAESNSFAVEVINLPGINNSDFADITLCEIETYTLTAPNNVDQVIWFKDGVVFNDTDQSITIDEAGTYQLEIQSGPCVDRSDMITVSINELPSLDFLPDSIEICAGEQASIEAPADMDSYLWIKDGNVFPGVISAVLQTSEAGLYQVEIRLDGCTKLSKEILVEVNTLEPIEVFSSNLIDCGVESILLDLDGLDYDTLFLTLNGEVILMSPEPFIISESGTYTIIGKTGDCSTESNNFAYEFNGFPQISPVAAEVFVCPGDAVTLEVNGQENYEYLWTSENGTVVGNQMSVEVMVAGTYFVNATDPVSGCFSEISVEMINYETTVPTIDLLDNMLTSSEATTYQWYVDGDLIADATMMTYDAPTSGNYQVATTDANGCVTFSEEVFVELTAVDQIEALQQFDLYPNPVQDQLTLALTTTQSLELDITIHNQLGQSLWTASVQQQGTQSHIIPVQILTPGLYYLTLQDENGGTQTLRFTKLN